jgi:small-conductance mechanosensitive channel
MCFSLTELEDNRIGVKLFPMPRNLGEPFELDAVELIAVHEQIATVLIVRPDVATDTNGWTCRMHLTIAGGLLDWINQQLSWIPEWAVGLAMIALAIVAAVAAHAATVKLVRRLARNKDGLLARAMLITYRPSRYAFVCIAVALVLPLAPLSDRERFWLTHAMLIAFIALAGWIASTALDVASGQYLRRFRIDTADNLLARKHITQVRLLRRVANTVIVVFAIAAASMTFGSVRQFGVSLFASAGVAGLVIGLAARPVLSNLIAGIQLAVSQPIRIEDAVLVENEFGWIEEITSTYVVVRLWDWRRMILPLSYFIEKPFQNWTREGSAIIGSVMLYLNHGADVARIRTKLEEIVRQSRCWDHGVVNLQVTNAKEWTIKLRALVSARDSSLAGDLQAEVREKLLAFIRDEMPEALPKLTTDLGGARPDFERTDAARPARLRG